MTGKILYKELSFEIVGSAMEVHRELGFGYLEKVYENALIHELRLRGIQCEQQKQLIVSYKGAKVGHYVADIVVEEKIILELKTARSITDFHHAQALNYLAATGLDLSIILNFGGRSLTYKRIIKTK